MAADSLGDRIKGNYENRSKTELVRRMPVILRVDGKAFHTYTRGCKRPFDQDLIDCMVNAAVAVAREMQGFKMGFVQSDEASFLLTDYDDITTEAWFDYKVQKMCSVAASMMTAHFNIEAQKIRQRELEIIRTLIDCIDDGHISSRTGMSEVERSLQNPIGGKPAFFDARCFNVPEAEVANAFLWRSQDWNRNSIQMMAHSYFSQKQLHGKSREDMHNMLHEIGKNWTTDTSEQQRNGTWISRDLTLETSILPQWADVNGFLQKQLLRGRPYILKGRAMPVQGVSHENETDLYV